MNRSKEINILLLGETGVGKSTFVNAIANYIIYEKLEIAEMSQLISIVSSSFTMTNDDYEEINIKIDQDECFFDQSSANENFVKGQSSTQKPRAYSFSYGDKIINLIDTPGIGDTRGIAKDKENIANILQFISNHKEIHGICILLKPNNAKLTMMFRFYIKELLTHLHRNAAQNIVFCFTNCRSTFYKPGDTLPALRKLLEENPDVEIPLAKHTIYCMDNEPFRFLVALKNGMTFSDKDRQDYGISWDRAVAETERLFSHIQILPPHTVQDTLSLNEARNLIVDLSSSMLKNEREIIIKKRFVYACFLKENAIFIYNDAVFSYLEHLIYQEKNKINAGGDNKTLLGLEQMKNDYEEEVKILDDAICD
jgi:GTPase SAR1 family protein